jgi:hypothetical protein
MVVWGSGGLKVVHMEGIMQSSLLREEMHGLVSRETSLSFSEQQRLHALRGDALQTGLVALALAAEEQDRLLQKHAKAQPVKWITRPFLDDDQTVYVVIHKTRHGRLQVQEQGAPESRVLVYTADGFPATKKTPGRLDVR